MTCRECADFLDDFLAGRLDRDVHRSFEHHLGICVNCRRYLDHYRQAVALGRTAFENAGSVLPWEVPEDLVTAVLAARRRPS